MKLYHGSNSIHLDSILKQGIHPRYKNKGNWAEGNISMPWAVYLTDSLAPYFAAWGQQELEGTRGLILEIDTDRLLPDHFLPDEDFLRIILKRQKQPIPRKNAFKQWRNLVLANRHLWQKSLETIGTCAYLGFVDAKAITRYVLFERDSEHVFRYDNSVSPMAHRFTGARNREYLRLLFDGEFDPVHLNTFFFDENNEPLVPESPAWIAKREELIRQVIKHRNETVEVCRV
jgi:hypothetical protein